MLKQRYIDIIERFEKRRILVVGDVMLDEFLRGKVERISPEAPVPIVNIQKKYLLPGGASNVAKNITTLDGSVYLVGVIGEDENAKRFLHVLNESGISSDYLVVERDRPTTIKTRIIAGSQQIVRCDIEETGDLEDETQSRLDNVIDNLKGKYDAVIISDYDKGVIHKGLLQKVIRDANENHVPICVDPNVTHFFDYINVTMLTPNQKEFEISVNRRLKTTEMLHEAGVEILEKLLIGGLLVTQGENGMTLFEMQDNITHIPTVAKQVYDVTGAGDTVIGVMTLALAAGASPLEAAKISNAAAGVVVGKRGTATLTRHELYSILEELQIET